MDPVEALVRIAYLLERGREPTHRVKAFRTAAGVLRALAPGEVEQRAATGRLRDLPGIGETTERVIREALAGEVPAYLRRLEVEGKGAVALTGAAAELLEALRGDCHTHSDWSDGGSSIEEMAAAARGLGHEWVALTDHSPRLSVAKGLSPERLRHQLDVVVTLNERLAPFRILTGIEVDILDDGSLDQEEDLLARLDLVVASVHSKLRMDRAAMTRRMLLAVANPHVDVLGHCTGRIVSGRGGGDRNGRGGGDRHGRGGGDRHGRGGGNERGRGGGDRHGRGGGNERGRGGGNERGRGRPESEFDAELVFAACLRFSTAVEVNSRPERLDPPKRLLRLAVDMGCLLAVDSDAHAPGQLEWQPYGCERAAACGARPESVVNTWSAERLLAWTASSRG